MSTIGHIKHVFPGTNTPQGFYSFFQYLASASLNNQIYVIKGGPGTGKSSFMKRLGTYASEHGYDVEFHHCSCDPNSLDGIYIPALKCTVLDGTAPHIVDPANPGGIDTILHFGDFWNEEALKNNRAQIEDCNTAISNCFKKSYYYIAAAKNIYDAIKHTQSEALIPATLHEQENTVLHDLFKGISPAKNVGSERHLFGTSITCEGLVDYLHTIIGKTPNIYFIKETPAANSMELMNRIKDTAKHAGLDVECFHSPIVLDKIEDLYIPALDTCITVSNDYHKAKVFPTHIYDFTTCLDYHVLKELQPDIDRDKKLFTDLIDKGVSCIAQAKKIHDTLESYYISAVDFSKIDALYDELVLKIFGEA